jgi:hypothetical protein
MVSFVELRDCEPAAFGLAGQHWQQLARQVADRGNEVDKHLAALADWGALRQKPPRRLSLMSARSFATQ